LSEIAMNVSCSNRSVAMLRGDLLCQIGCSRCESVHKDHRRRVSTSLPEVTRAQITEIALGTLKT
jgi:hypothetical protein